MFVVEVVVNVVVVGFSNVLCIFCYCYMRYYLHTIVKVMCFVKMVVVVVIVVMFVAVVGVVVAVVVVVVVVVMC